MFLYKKSMYKERGEWHQNMNYVIIHILQKEKEERMAIYLVQGLLSIVTLIKRRDDFIRQILRCCIFCHICVREALI